MNHILEFIIDEKGQGMTEYGIVLGTLSLAAFALISALSTQVLEMYQAVLDTVSSRINGGLTSSTSTDTTN